MRVQGSGYRVHGLGAAQVSVLVRSVEQLEGLRSIVVEKIVGP